MAKGIDVSKHQGAINWGKVKAAGVQFAMIRAGYGNSISQKDPMFDTNVKGALAQEIAVGSYWFSYAVSVADALKEAVVFRKVLEPYKGKLTYPAAFDWEYDSYTYAVKNGVIPTKKLITDMAVAFLSDIQTNGWYPDNYTNLDYSRNKFDMPRMTAFDLWLADYSGGPDITCGIQQSSSTGKIDGINNAVDICVSYKDYPAIIKALGKNGFTKPTQTTAVGIDTTTTVKLMVGGTYQFYTTCAAPVTVTIGTGGVASIAQGAKNGDKRYYRITAKAKGQAGIYTQTGYEKAFKRFVISVE